MMWLTLLAAPPAWAGCIDEYLDASLGADWHIPTAECVEDITLDLARSHRDRARAVPFGRTLEGRPMTAVRITNDVDDASSLTRPSVLVFAGVHGNEVMATRAALDWMRRILEEPTDVAWLASDGSAGATYDELLDEVQVWIVPMAQPDQYFHNDRWTEAGVNPNRNWAFRWVENVEGSTEPMDQPETRALAGLFKRAQPSVFASIHGQATDIDNVTASGCALQYSSPNNPFPNWSMSVPRTQYTAGGNNATYRGRHLLNLITPEEPVSLARLSEWDLDADASNGRLYSPYDPSVVCTVNTVQPAPGGGAGGAQTRGWGWTHEGAVSILVEVLEEKLGPSGTIPGTGVWRLGESESDVRDVARDTQNALGLLVDVAGNPAPFTTGSSGGPIDHVDVAVGRVSSLHGTCDALDTFSPHQRLALPHHTRVGQYGTYPIECGVEAWGTRTSTSYGGEVSVRDMDTGTTTVIGTFFGSNLAPGTRVTHTTAAYTFEPDTTYRVTCEIYEKYTDETETDQTIFDLDDDGCIALNGDGEHCASSTVGEYRTNNARVITFVATHDADATCPNGDPADRWVDGGIAANGITANQLVLLQ